MGKAAVFVKYDVDSQTLFTYEDTSKLAGLYQIYVDLVDSKNRTSAQTYLLSLIIFDEYVDHDKDTKEEDTNLPEEYSAIKLALETS